jgi:hypothetical protein
MTIADEIKHYLASKVIVKEKVDGETADARFDVCLKCEYRNPEENKCIICTCFLDLKKPKAGLIGGPLKTETK